MTARGPEYWRGLAAEARATAANLPDDIERLHMIACAETYERLAKMAEMTPFD